MHIETRTSHCDEVTELLPWLLNGALENDERQQVEAHLRTCDRCRREFARTAEVWQLLDRHVPSLALAEYAQGAIPEGLDSQTIEHHLAACASCRQEFQWAASDQVLPFDAGRSPRKPTQKTPGTPERMVYWRRLAYAATLAALLASGGLLWKIGSPATPLVAESQTVEDSQTDSGTHSAGLFVNGFESGNAENWSAVVSR